MPLYDFHCSACDTAFEEYTPADAPPAPCPACGSADTERVISGFAGPFNRRPQGGDARRLDANRMAKETARLERKAARQEQRKRDGA